MYPYVGLAARGYRPIDIVWFICDRCKKEGNMVQKQIELEQEEKEREMARKRKEEEIKQKEIIRKRERERREEKRKVREKRREEREKERRLLEEMTVEERSAKRRAKDLSDLLKMASGVTFRKRFRYAEQALRCGRTVQGVIFDEYLDSVYREAQEKKEEFRLRKSHAHDFFRVAYESVLKKIEEAGREEERRETRALRGVRLREVDRKLAALGTETSGEGKIAGGGGTVDIHRWTRERLELNVDRMSLLDHDSGRVVGFTALDYYFKEQWISIGRETQLRALEGIGISAADAAFCFPSEASGARGGGL